MVTLVEHGFDISGPTDNRPASADIGCRYWDTDTNEFLIWNGTAWSPVGGDSGDPATASGTGVTSVESVSSVRTTTLTIAALSITMTDATTAGCHGSQKILQFPEGNIVVLGATTNLDITAGVGGISDTAAVIGAIGSAAVGTDNAALTSTEANIVPSTSATLTAGAGACDGQSTGIAVLDGTASAAAAYLNFAVPDAGSSGNDTLSVSGTVTLIWMNSGDN